MVLEQRGGGVGTTLGKANRGPWPELLAPPRGQMDGDESRCANGVLGGAAVGQGHGSASAHLDLEELVAHPGPAHPDGLWNRADQRHIKADQHLGTIHRPKSF
ncbi:unnamed protein product [Tetraodon nigroviridis]|uniref:(spotted green pufferfish) hypothetical protein n=1 Tax=Tetraodon nigroviridis TaxID=99883 RepID=Q4T9I7_TETNG|nr:unnamed protein product [Tetraodon nigroviridis]